MGQIPKACKNTGTFEALNLCTRACAEKYKYNA